MSARTGMGDIIQELRNRTDAGTADYTLGTATFWDDDQMQSVLDQNRVDLYREELVPLPDTIGGGSIVYKRYESAFGWLEQVTSGSLIFQVETAGGDLAGTADYSVDHTRGLVTFTADQGGTAYFLTGRSYNMNAAAADVWRKKKGYYAKAIDVESDGQKLRRSQLFEHCSEMVEFYENQGGGAAIVEFVA